MVVGGAALAYAITRSNGGDGSDEYCALLAERLQPISPLRDFDVLVYLDASVTEARLDTMRAEIEDDARISQPARFVDQQAAYREFLEIFAATPEMGQNVSAADLPPSFRFDLVDDGATDDVVADYSDEADVHAVTPRTDLGFRMADVTLNPFLLDTAYPGLGATFDEDNLSRLEDLEAGAPDDVADEIATLTAALRDDVADDGYQLDSSTAADEQVAAAERVRDDAADRCGLEPQGPATA